MLMIYVFYVRLSELQTMHNESQMILQETRHSLKDAIAQGNEGIESKMAENKEEAKDSLTSLRYGFGTEFLRLYNNKRRTD